MNGPRKATVNLGLVSLLGVLLNSCLFPELIDVFVSEEGDGFLVSVSVGSDISLCSNEGGGDFLCLYAGEAGASITSDVTLTGADIAFLLLLDPMIVQLPLAATSFAGTFLHNDTSMSGNLAITSGLAAFDADFDTTVVAEPGTQFVILDLPAGAPTQGSFSFNFNYTMPPGTTSLQMKSMFTGRVDAAGQTYYPPLLPCETNFASVPALNVPFPSGGQVVVPADMAQGCTNAVYNYGAAAPVPAGDRWSLLALALLLGTAAAASLRWRARHNG